jgi:hypothetical protein
MVERVERHYVVLQFSRHRVFGVCLKRKLRLIRTGLTQQRNVVKYLRNMWPCVGADDGLVLGIKDSAQLSEGLHILGYARSVDVILPERRSSNPFGTKP